MTPTPTSSATPVDPLVRWTLDLEEATALDAAVRAVEPTIRAGRVRAPR
ncbi:hypothetical protein [Nocardioides hwasunensis]|uniref:Uncharacterized protein n=1 Tax=Nocardioides hwasunensis TaxID=397258 RepID=A0ABR8MFW7_9ACTN|nr:hypothetical protein [Nocardioides hwasunensis]MBD3914778.1 hypothetical protein [Nocardioides hwasunensis]